MFLPSRFLRLFRIASIASLASFVGVAVGCNEGPTPLLDEDEEDGSGELNQSDVKPARERLSFAKACRPGTKLTIAAVGDVLMHERVQRQAYAAADGHHSLWKQVEPLLERADLTYANLEVPCADGVGSDGRPMKDPGRRVDNQVYSGYPQFNAHPSVISALKESGVDIVSTANNHALDRKSLGVDRTIANLKTAGMPFTGTRSTAAMDAPWHTVTKAKGFTIAWLACSFGTNGIPDTERQVLGCYDNKGTLLETVRTLKKRDDIDAVIVTPHWGVEYHHSPESEERGLAREILNAGAAAIIGNHPHVTQSWEKYTTTDGREGFIAYALGNFVSSQEGMPRRSSLILYLGLTKGTDGVVTVNGVRYMPITMINPPYTAILGTGESLALTTSILGKWNKLEAGDALVTNPECLP